MNFPQGGLPTGGSVKDTSRTIVSFTGAQDRGCAVRESCGLRRCFSFYELAWDEKKKKNCWSAMPEQIRVAKPFKNRFLNSHYIAGQPRDPKSINITRKM